MPRRVIVVTTEERDVEIKGVTILDKPLPISQEMRMEKALALRGLYVRKTHMIPLNATSSKALVGSVIDWAVAETGIILAGDT